MNKRQKIIVSITGITLILLILVGLTYAYFLTRIQGNTNTKSISVTTADLKLVYGDGNGIISGEKIIPGTSLTTKTFTVTNTGNETVYNYLVVFEEVTNNLSRPQDLVYILDCTSNINGNTCKGVENETQLPIGNGNGMGIIVSNNIEEGETQTYELTVKYIEAGIDQSDDMNKNIEAKINIKDLKGINPYSSNQNSLAYNIINNAIKGVGNTNFSNAPLSNIPEEPVLASLEYRTDDNLKSSVGNQKKLAPSKTITYASSYTVSVTNEDGYLYLTYELDDPVSGTISSVNQNLVGKYYFPTEYTSDVSYDPVQKITEVVVGSSSANTYIVSDAINSYISSENILTVTNDNYGVSYYYRGDVNSNYLNFANMCFRIVRIEGDGSVKLILADKDNECNSSQYSANNYDSAFIGSGTYGYTTEDYYNIVDFDAGGSVQNGAKYIMDNWYYGSFGNREVNLLKEDSMCIGNTNYYYSLTRNEKSTDITDLEDSVLYYQKYKDYIIPFGIYRPTAFICTSDELSHIGYVGLLSLDEAIYAGLSSGGIESLANYFNSSTLSYLNTNAITSSWWLSSLSGFTRYIQNGGDRAAIVDSKTWGYPILSKDSLLSKTENIRPTITLKPNVISTGSGTISDPYVVE